MGLKNTFQILGSPNYRADLCPFLNTQHTVLLPDLFLTVRAYNYRQEHVILEQSLREEAALLKAAKDDLSRRAEHQEAELIDLQVRVCVRGCVRIGEEVFE